MFLLPGGALEQGSPPSMFSFSAWRSSERICLSPARGSLFLCALSPSAKTGKVLWRYEKIVFFDFLQSNKVYNTSGFSVWLFGGSSARKCNIGDQKMQRGMAWEGVALICMLSVIFFFNLKNILGAWG